MENKITIEISFKRDATSPGYKANINFKYYNIVVNGQEFGECIYHPSYGAWRLVENSLPFNLNCIYPTQSFWIQHKTEEDLKDFIKEQLDKLKEILNKYYGD